MNSYELTYLISPELTEEAVKDCQEKIISLIQSEEGILVETNSPFRKKLAYPVKKQGQAYLNNLKFQLSSEKIVDLEKKIKSEGRIIRYLILTKPPTKAMIEREKLPTLKPLKSKPKVELKEIEKKLEEILGE